VSVHYRNGDMEVMVVRLLGVVSGPRGVECEGGL
jgi:hypothetical protein